MNKDKGPLLFWGKDDDFSQFHPAQFEIDGIPYSCTEQYMMHQKAVLFEDDEMARNILKETKPDKMKAFGRKVSNFDDEIWKEKCRKIVEDGNYAKFNQNEHLKKYLLGTESRILAEASPFDKRWGIGLGKADKRAQNPKEWKGKNWLGEAIMIVRKKLREEASNEDE